MAEPQRNPRIEPAGTATVDREEESAVRAGGRRRNLLPYVAAGIALVAILYFGWRWWEGRHWASTDDAQVGGDVVPVLARVSGYVRQVAVNENVQVKAGQLLVVIDDAEYRQKVALAQAQLAIAGQAAGAGAA